MSDLYESGKIVDPLNGREQFTATQLNSLDTINNLYGEKLQKLVLMGMGRNENSIGPHVQVVDLDAPVHSAVSMRSNPHGVTTITKIRNPNITDDFVVNEIQPRIARSIAQLREAREQNPEFVASLDRHYSPDKGLADAASWYADPAKGAIMIRSSLVPNANGVGQHKVYHIVITSHNNEKISGQLSAIMNKEGMTAQDVAESGAFSWAARQSDRNANRLLHLVKGSIDEALAAKGAKAGNSGVRSQFDNLSFVPKYHQPEMMGIPDSTLRFNGVNSLYKQGDTDPYAVAFYQNCADGKRSQYSTLISGDYIHPIYEFHGAPIRTDDGKVLGHPGFIENEQYANAMPIFSNFTTRAMREEIGQSLTPDVASDLEKQIARANISDKIALSSLHGAFKQPTQKELEHLEQNAASYGLDKHHPYTTYNPVITVI